MRRQQQRLDCRDASTGQGVPATTRRQKSQAGIPLLSLCREHSPADSLIWDFCSPELGEYISVVFRHLVCGTLLWQPLEETIPGSGLHFRPQVEALCKVARGPVFTKLFLRVDWALGDLDRSWPISLIMAQKPCICSWCPDASALTDGLWKPFSRYHRGLSYQSWAIPETRRASCLNTEHLANKGKLRGTCKTHMP